MALPVGTIEHGEVVSRPDEEAVHGVDQTPISAHTLFALLRIFLLRLAWLILDGRHTDGVLPPWTVLCKQPASSEAGTARRRRFQPKHLVAGPASSHGLGRELARQSPSLSRFGMLQPPLVAGRYRLVRDSNVAGSRSREERQGLQRLAA